MKKKKLLFAAVTLLILVFILEVWHFIGSVTDELWTSSIRTITESTHQGANALNLQFETDFRALEQLWSTLADAKDDSLSMPDVALYPSDQSKTDRYVADSLKGTSLERGILDSHISSVTGENVFHIFLKGTLLDGTPAYLVKEYHTKEIARQFTLSFYDNSGFSYLVNSDGTIMVRPSHRNSNKTVSNIFDMITPKENEQPMMDAFAESIREFQTGWARFTCNGTGMVFCYEPLRADSNWLLISIVPEYVITKQASSILIRTLIFSGIAILCVLVIVTIFIGTKMHENKEHTRELKQTLEAADAANRAKVRFLTDISHDIRTPLNGIIGMTAIARENLASQERIKDCLDKIKTSGVQLLSLVSDILDMSQIEQGKVILKEESIAFEQFFAETVELMRPKAQDKDLALEIAPVHLSKPNVMGDPLRIRQILLNLIGNAINYTPSRGRVSLELTQTEPADDEYGIYQFRCTDTGIGMEPEFLPRLFLPFERAKNTTDSKISGTGVGLAITKNLLDLMGGTIDVQSVPGQGSVFTVIFRLQYQEEIPEPETPTEEELPDFPEEEEPDYTDKRLLLVEDNELNMDILEELLDIIGVQTEKAYNGQEAVDTMSEHAAGYYDLIFMDIQMPVMDGYEATEQIRRMDGCDSQKLPIYAVSANALANDIQKALDSGMNGHIAKPVDLDVLEKVLKQCFS